MAESDETKDQSAAGYERLFPQRLAKYRHKAGMTESRLAEKAGLERRHIQRWEAGKGQPTIANLRRVCDALRVTPNQMIYGTDEPFGGSTYDVLSRKGPSHAPAVVAALMTLIDTDDRRTLVDLIVSMAETQNGQDTRDLLENVSVIVSSVEGSQGLKNAVDETADMFDSEQ